MVARAVFGVPPSTAVLEKDFSAAGDLIIRKRGSLDAVFAEMVLFLHEVLDKILMLVPIYQCPGCRQVHFTLYEGSKNGVYLQ